jgi:serine/threonine-protein kinase
VKLIRNTVSEHVDAFVRFTREARIAASISSNHIIKVLDLGLSNGGTPFLVMELLEGVDLETLLRETGLMPVDRAMTLASQICEGLAEAHAATIVHRDLKPSNIFICRDGGGADRAVLLDFGISKLMSSTEELELTRTGALIGSPRYMAPEQLSNPRATDQRADIWSLGIILYEIFAGESPYKSRTLVQLVAEILQRTPRAVHMLRPEIPEAVNDVIMRCLHRDPEERYSDAKVVFSELEKAMRDTLPKSQTPAPARNIWAVSAAALLLFAGGFAAYALSSSGDREPPLSKKIESVQPASKPPSSTAKSEADSPSPVSDGDSIAKAAEKSSAPDADKSATKSAKPNLTRPSKASRSRGPKKKQRSSDASAASTTSKIKNVEQDEDALLDVPL